MQCLEKQLDGGEVEFVDKVFPGSSDSGFAILTSLGRSLDYMLMMEFVKASCHLEIKDEMEWEQIGSGGLLLDIWLEGGM